MKYIVNGIPVKLAKVDLDGDGRAGGVEYITAGKDPDIIPIQQSSEMKDALSELNKDDISPLTNSSAIELRARIDDDLQESGLTQFITLISMGVYPKDSLKLAMTALRLSVSRQGKGRGEIVSVTTGQREHEEAKSGYMGRLGKALIGKRDEPQRSVGL